jgi:hypothetical protein
LSAGGSWFNLIAMTLVLKSPNEAPYEAGKDLNVVIVGEDSILAAGRVYEILDLLELTLKEEGRLLYQWWDFDVLAFISLRELAAMEAATADIIIISVHKVRAIPERVTAWMKRCWDLRKDRPGALVAVLDSDLEMSGAAPEILSQLKKVAACGHLDFFATRAKEETNKEVTRGAVKPSGNSPRRAKPCAARIAGRRESVPLEKCGP